jgi:hypothetical protein
MKYKLIIAPERRNDKSGQPITKNVPIFAQISFAGNRLFYFTGYKIDTEFFDTEKQQATQNSFGLCGKEKVQYNIINKRLTAINAALVLFLTDKTTASKSDVKSLLDAICKKAKRNTKTEKMPIPEPLMISDFYGLFRKYQHEAKISEGRRRHVKSLINRIEQYQAARGINLSFDNLTTTLLNDFEKYLKTETPKAKGKNTLHSIMKTFKTVYRYAVKELSEMGIEIKDAFKGFTVESEIYGTPVYITSSERDILFNAQLPTRRLQQVRDVFVFQCFIGARVGDLCKMTKANIQNGVLSYIPRKTADGRPVTVEIPLHPKAIEILSRYDLPGGMLLPFISDQRYNSYIKEVFEAVGLTRMVTRRNPTTGDEEQIRICDIASSHMSRRCFVGNLFGKVDSGIIASMSGHVAHSRAFSRYYKVDPEHQKAAINLF